MANTFGQVFRITTWGESHGGSVGVIVDGCPSQLPISQEDIQFELDRRRPGQSSITTARDEKDIAKIQSGISDGMTLGTPIAILVENTDTRPQDYSNTLSAFRPSHADYTTMARYGILSPSGGGRASARETVGRVAGGAIAKKLLKNRYGVEILAYVSQIHRIQAEIDAEKVTFKQIESNPVRCPDAEKAAIMEERILQAKTQGNTLGGVITCVVRGCPAGWGEPVFDKVEANLAKAMLSIPACRGFEIGDGFASALLTGKEHNDPFIATHDGIRTATNHSGGIQGGITNGMPILFRVAFKPTATLGIQQETVDRQGNPTTLTAKGRHDPCVLPRAVPIVEAMAALVLADSALLRNI